MKIALIYEMKFNLTVIWEKQIQTTQEPFFTSYAKSVNSLNFTEQ